MQSMVETVSVNNTCDISIVLLRSYTMMEESAGQHLKDIENILEV